MRGLEHFIAWELDALGIDAPVRVSQLTRLGFDASLRDIFLALCAGGTVCIPPVADIRADGLRLIEWLKKERVEVVHCVPTVLRLLLRALRPGEMLPALCHVLVAGEPLLPADVQTWFATLGGQAILRNLYGATETTMVKFVHVVEVGDAALTSVPIGRPMPGAAALVLDARGEPAPHGVTGEIHVWTPFRTLGYYRRPDLTARSFVPVRLDEGAPNDGAGDGDVHYRTGDLGRTRPDGTFEYVGRRDAQIKIRGVRVELGEIETALLEHPEVRLATVVLREDPSAHPMLVAYVVSTRDRESRNGSDTGSAADRAADRAQTARLREHLRPRLPASMMPAAFVFLDRLPLTSNGKVDRRALPAPVISNGDEADDTLDERTASEQMLSNIFADVLRLERVGVDDDFFDRGGHSLVAMQAVSRIRQALRVEVTLGQMLASPTARALARVVDRLLAGGAAPAREEITRIPRSGVLPVSANQEGALLLDMMTRRRLGVVGSFHISRGLRLTGAFDVNAMTRAMHAIVARHEALRTGFMPAPLTRSAGPDGRSGRGSAFAPFIVADPRSVTSVVSLDLVDPPARDREVLRISRDVAIRPFDLSAPPLMRCVVLRLAADEHLLLIAIHHLVCDGWSFRVLLEDLQAAYRDCLEGKTPVRDGPAIDFVDIAHWERQWLESPAASAAIEYWNRQSAAFVPALPRAEDLPFAFTGMRDPNPVKEDENVTLDDAFTSALRDVSRRRDLTLHMLFMAAFHVVLGIYTGKPRTAIRTQFACRSRLEMERVIGWFARSHVIGVVAGPDATLDNILERTREAVLGAHAHQDMPEAWLWKNALTGGKSVLPFSDVFLSLDLGVRESVAGGEPFTLPFQSAQRLLRLTIIDMQRELVVGCRYSGGSFSRSGVATMLGDLTHVLKQIVNSPHQRVADISLAARPLTREVHP
jgi:non-ribosomal peptide synthetase component F